MVDHVERDVSSPVVVSALRAWRLADDAAEHVECVLPRDLTDRYLATFPGLAIMITVMGFNLLGDGLRDLGDPRLRGR